MATVDSQHFVDSGNGHDIFCSTGLGYPCNCGKDGHSPLNAGSGSSPFGTVTWQTIYDTSATLPVVPKQNVDPKEEALRAKVIPPWRGEAACIVPKVPAGYPRLPYFVNDDACNEESFRALKRFISTNMREWGVCRHSGAPFELRIEGATMKDDPYGGEYARPTFYCATCGVWG